MLVRCCDLLEHLNITEALWMLLVTLASLSMTGHPIKPAPLWFFNKEADSVLHQPLEGLLRIFFLM